MDPPSSSSSKNSLAALRFGVLISTKLHIRVAINRCLTFVSNNRDQIQRTSSNSNFRDLIHDESSDDTDSGFECEESRSCIRM